MDWYLMWSSLGESSAYSICDATLPRQRLSPQAVPFVLLMHHNPSLQVTIPNFQSI
jgi:hypothetical protein